MPKDVMGVKRSGIARGFQNFWFGVLFFCQNGEKSKNVLKNSQFLCCFEVFWTFLNFEWKTVHQTKDFVNPLQFCFFWHPWHPWVWMNSGWKEILSKVPVCMIRPSINFPRIWFSYNRTYVPLGSESFFKFPAACFRQMSTFSLHTHFKTITKFSATLEDLALILLIWIIWV